MGTCERHAKPIAEGNKALPNFRLEQDDDGNADIEEAIAEDEFEGSQILFDGKPVEENDGGDSRGHRGGASTAE